MITVKKKTGKPVHAYPLGKPHPALDRLILEGKLICHENGIYEIFSQEARSGKGQVARDGDYVKIDSAGYPYPNEKAHFKANHLPIEGTDHTYEQLSQTLHAWLSTEPMCPEVCFLIEHKNLKLDPDKPEAFFTAPLWGTVETADKNAALVFYSIIRSREGDIVDADFNFVCREEFDKTYDIICSDASDML